MITFLNLKLTPSNRWLGLFFLIGFFQLEVLYPNFPDSIRVLDAVTHSPIHDAEIFINGSMAGFSNNLGYFSNIPNNGTDEIKIQKTNYLIFKSDSILSPIFLEPFVFPAKPVFVRGKYLLLTAKYPTESFNLNSTAIRTASSTIDLIDRFPGVSIRTYGGPAGISTVSNHGGQGGRIAVQLAGIDLNNEQSGSADLSQIPADLLTNAQFIPQGASARFGSSAMTGLINLNPITPGWKTRLSLGDNGQKSMSIFGDVNLAGLSGGLGFGRRNYSGNIVYRETGKYNAANNAQGNYNWLSSSLNQDFYYGWSNNEISEDFSISASILNTVSSRSLVPFIYNTQEYHPLLKDTLLTAGINIHYHSALLQFSSRSNAIDYYSNSSSMPEVDENHFIQTRTGKLKLPLGKSELFLDIKHFNSRSSSAEEAKKYQFAAGTNLSMNFEPYSLDVSLRETWDSDHTPVFSHDWIASFKGMVALRSIHLIYSRNYKFPGFNDLYWEPFGNPDLKTETSDNYYWKNQFKLKGFQLQLDGHLIHYHNLIKWTPQTSASGLWSPENITDARSAGIFAGLNYRLSSFLQLEFDYNYNKMEKLSDDPGLIRYVPENSAAFSQMLSFKDFTAAIFYKYTGRQVKGTDYLGDPAYLPAYGLLSLNLEKYFILNENSISVQLNCENLLNKQFQRVYGYPEPGRTITATLNIKEGKENEKSY